MNSLVRKRPLDEIESCKSDWLTYNPLFYKLIPEFDESFDRGVGINLNYYVERLDNFKNSFESKLYQNLFTTHKLKSGKVYNLRGSVGAGKTSLCKYLCEKLLPEKDDALGIYLDVWPTEINSTPKRKKLNKLFLNATFNSFKNNGKYISPKDFWAEIAIALGFPSDIDPSELLKMSKSFTYEDIIEYLKYQPYFDNILIIIDNIDESNETTIEECRKFSLDIAKYTRSFGNKHFSILLPAREYTISRYFNQEHFAHIELPPITESKVVIKKLEQAKDSIEAAFIPQERELEYNIPIYPGYKQQMRKVIITKKGALSFVSELTNHLLSENENIFYTMINALANKNLKIVIGNMYNFIHSCNLPATKLFEKTIIPKEFQSYKEEADEISFNLTLSCLLAIHYPFYDVDNSHVINVFNLNNSNAINDFKNTLTIPRLLCYLLNSGETTYEKLLNDFKTYGYQKSLTRTAVDKCFNYGLIISDYGCNSKTITQSSTIKKTPITELYIKLLITRLFYLSYISDDTPMPVEYRNDIIKKYSSIVGENNKSAIDKMIHSVSLFVDFIKQEEEFEKVYIQQTLKKDYENFLNIFGINHNEKWISISEFINLNWSKDEYQRAPSLRELKKFS